jgi:hypothetical protein
MNCSVGCARRRSAAKSELQTLAWSERQQTFLRPYQSHGCTQAPHMMSMSTYEMKSACSCDVVAGHS